MTASKAVSKGIQSANIFRTCPVADSTTPNPKQNPILKKTEAPALTSDKSRASVSAALASRQESAPPAPEKSAAVSLLRPYCEANSVVSRSLASSACGVVAAVKVAPARLAGRLARVTAYWAAEGDYYTERCISATGVRLHDGHCAVDPNIIPYGSVVEITGVGKFLAVDTGSAVVSRAAARQGGHTSAERNAIVVDLFFENRSAGERFAAATARYATISWWTPTAMDVAAKAARSLFVEEDWTKIQGKQL